MLKMELTSLLAAGFFWLYRLDNRLAKPHVSPLNIKGKQDSAEEKLQAQRAEMEKMQDDLRRKSQEIANLLISMERKNEALAIIKKDVQHALDIARHLEDKSLLTPLFNINTEINDNLEGDSVIERFEKEYNFANNDFLHRLSSRFPTLNMNERKACVYLRMNNSTKEIATLLHLSVRGVETIRYNLRKKMGLDRGENLSSYLNNL